MVLLPVMCRLRRPMAFPSQAKHFDQGRRESDQSFVARPSEAAPPAPAQCSTEMNNAEVYLQSVDALETYRCLRKFPLRATQALLMKLPQSRIAPREKMIEMIRAHCAPRRKRSPLLGLELKPAPVPAKREYHGPTSDGGVFANHWPNRISSHSETEPGQRLNEAAPGDGPL